MSEKKKSSAKFEDDLKRLEEIVQKLESGVPIEEAMVYYEEGIKLCNKLEAKLSNIEQKIYQVNNIDKLSTGEDDEIDLKLFE